MGKTDSHPGQIAKNIERYEQALAIFLEIGAQHLVKQADDNIAIVEAKMKGGGAG